MTGSDETHKEIDASREAVEVEDSSKRKLGSEALLVGNYNPSDTFTYKEVQDLMDDPNEIRAVPGPKRSFL